MSRPLAAAPGLDELLADPGLAQDPYPVYRRLRAESPVHWSPHFEGWLVTRHADVKDALKDHERLSNFGWERRYLEGLPADLRERIPVLVEHFATAGLINADPPLHTRLRRLVGGAFVPRAIERLRGHVDELVEELLGAAPPGDVDVIRDLAYPLPTIVIAELFGAPRADRDLFKGWSNDLTSFFATASPLPERADQANRSLGAFRAYVRELVADRRRRPGDDVVSRLVGGDDDALTENEILATCVIFLVAGHETTTNLIANAVLALLRDPAALATVRDDPDGARAAVEETLRFDSPVQRVRRMSIADHELAGQPVRAGDAVYLVLGSANRDEAAFDEPDRFRPAREAAGGIAFGHGIHFCLGAALARLEAPTALAALVRQRPGLALVPGFEPRYRSTPTFRALDALPVRA